MVAERLIPLTSDRRSEFEPCQRVVFLDKKNSAPTSMSSLTCVINSPFTWYKPPCWRARDMLGQKEEAHTI